MRERMYERPNICAQTRAHTHADTRIHTCVALDAGGQSLQFGGSATQRGGEEISQSQTGLFIFLIIAIVIINFIHTFCHVRVAYSISV